MESTSMEEKESLLDDSHKKPPWRILSAFVRNNRLIVLNLISGIAGGVACFAFTYWLSRQIFYCPSWAIDCNVKSNVDGLAKHLGLVQGIVSAVHGTSMSMLAYAAYQFAETMLWTFLVDQDFTLLDIENYLSHARGALPSTALALYHSRKPKHVATVVLVGLIGGLLYADSILVGYAWTARHLPTTMYSNHTTGGGVGFNFVQHNPQAAAPSEPTNAYAIYSSWSNFQSIEMLPDLREYIMDRTNLSAIGNFTVHAVKASKHVKCHGTSIDFVDDSLSEVLDPWNDRTFLVRTHPSSIGTGLSENVTLRYQPRGMTVWVDDNHFVSPTRATTKLMFAIVNGTIDTGQLNELPAFLGGSNCIGCNGISALACEVDVSLDNGVACNGECTPELAKSLTSHTSLDSIDFIPVWLGAIPSLMGPFTLGAQPVLVPGTKLANSSFALPLAYTNIGEAAISSYEHDWAESNLTNFINVTSGALATYIGQAHADGWTLLQSSVETPRLDYSRAYVLLIPLTYILACVVVLATLSASMHQSKGINYLQRGRVRDLLIAGETDELREAVDDFRSGSEPKDTPFDQMQLRYGNDRGGHGVLGTQANLRPFVRRDHSSPYS